MNNSNQKNVKQERLIVMLPPQIAERLNILSERRVCSRSTLLRQIIVEHFRQEDAVQQVEVVR